jgi:hypothetical protein
VNIRGATKEFIVDSGSGVSLIKPGVYHSDRKPSATTLFRSDGGRARGYGRTGVRFSVNNCDYRHTFCVCYLPTDADGIFGTRFLARANASLDTGRLVHRLRKSPIANRGPTYRKRNEVNSEADRATRTIFPKPDRIRNSKIRSRNGKPQKIVVLEMEREPCFGARDCNAWNREAHVAAVAMQRGSDQRAKYRNGCSRKRWTNRRKTERE